MKSRLVIALCFLIFGCGTDARLHAPQAGGESRGETRGLEEIFEAYFEANLQLFPTFATSIGDHRYDDQLGITISEEHRAKQRGLLTISLGKLA